MQPKLSKRTLSALQRLITGNAVESVGRPLAPYRSGPQLVAFFNDLGQNDEYSFKGGFPSRWAYVEGCLEKLNGTPRIVEGIEAALHPRHFLDTPYEVGEAVAYFDKYLKYDGCELCQSGGALYRVRALGEPLVEVEAQLNPAQHASHEFIGEQIAKCDRKLREEDYDGAITNARSAVEAVLCDIESRIDPNPPPYDGDLAKLYKRVQKLLNLDPDRPDIGDSLRQLLRGLVSIVGGLAPLRNKMGDAHVRKYKPSRHHAKLAINASKTLLDFVYDSFEYQKDRGTLPGPEASDGSGTA